MPRLQRVLLFGGLVTFHASGYAQIIPKGDNQSISFTTDEGTYMSVDVSPDGKTLVFDLLGDLYTLPITGGQASPLLRGADWVRAPRFSPDGKKMAFISDRGDMNNIWVIDVASRRMRQLTTVESGGINVLGVHGTPIWLPNGREIAYLQEGLNEGRTLIKAVGVSGGHTHTLADKLESASSPAFLSTGNEFFSSMNIVDSHTRLRQQQLQRVDLKLDIVTPIEQGERRLTSLGGNFCLAGDMKPVLSRSGRYLAYIHTNEPTTGELRVRDLHTGEDTRLMALPDLINNWGNVAAVDDGYPGYAITPDEKYVVIWSQGKLFRVPVIGGNPKLIPFTVDVKKQVAAPLRANYRIPDGDLQVKAIRWPTFSADGNKMAFSAVGAIWTMDLPNANPHKLTSNEEFAIMPARSPDGKEVAYISFRKKNGNDNDPRRLMIRNIESGKTRVLTASEDSASYFLPSWSADGTKIAIVRQANQYYIDYGWIDLQSGLFHRVATTLSTPSAVWKLYVDPVHISFSTDGKRLLYIDREKFEEHEPYKLTLRSVDLDGSDNRELLTTADPSVTAIFPSPDEAKAIVLGWDYQAYLTEIPKARDTTKSVSVFDLKKKAALKQISTAGALYPRWINDQTLTFGWLRSIFKYQAEDKTPNQIATVNLAVSRRGNHEVYAIRNARVITLSGTEGAGQVIERATIVVSDKRITAVGPVESTVIPSHAIIIEASGTTIIPGLIDAHAHGIGRSLYALPAWISQGLSYGFTTCLDAATSLNDDTGLGDIELLEAGRLTGPRYFTTTGMVSSFGYCWAPESKLKYRSYNEVLNQVQRRVQLGAQQCIKQKVSDNYRQFSRWMAQAAREARVSAIAHIQKSPYQQLVRAVDGYHVDHNGLWAPCYRDIIEFMMQTGAIWTIHHGMGGGSISRPNRGDGEVEFAPMFERLADNKNRELRLSALPADWQTWENMTVDEMAPLELSRQANLDRLAALIMEAGGKIAGGSTDGGQGLRNHFELWGFRKEGMSPGDVLRTATMIPAEKLGIQQDVGSIEAGKIADMVILSDNPLERIESTLKIKYTILAGDIYDRETLQVIPPQKVMLSK